LSFLFPIFVLYLPIAFSFLIYSFSLHDALPISCRARNPWRKATSRRARSRCVPRFRSSELLECLVEEAGPAEVARLERDVDAARSEEHTSELQSRENLVCRLLLEKKNITHVDES